MLERENEALLERQRALYAEPGPLAEKWRTACAFLDEDIRSGYVRVLWELWAAGLDRRGARGRAGATAMGGWRTLLESVFATWAAELGVELPFSPRVLASLTANVFQGIEIELAGRRDRRRGAAPRGARRARRADRAGRAAGPPGVGAELDRAFLQPVEHGVGDLAPAAVDA